MHLSPKAWDLLALLLENRSRAVSKAELQERLWPDTFVEETNLAGLVAEIRRTLRDSASGPVFVRTVYGFGYRFIADVSTDRGEAQAPRERTKLFLVSEHREMMLMNGINIVGRAPDATIQLDAPGVSRHHARILVSDGTAVLEDAQSKNGTYLNGKRITASVSLNDGDEIRLGSVELTFRITTATGPTVTHAAEPG